MEIIQSIINTLNTIEVRGEENMDKLLGCIYALRDLQNKKTEEKAEVVENGG